MDLIRAFHLLDHPKAQLIMVGEGALRSEMERYIEDNQLSKVTLTGFINQQEIAEYYTMADVFVLPSGYGETWGLVVNEAMNFNLPLIVSDLVGCTDDLVHEGQNGFTFPFGDVEQLKEKMETMLSTETDLQRMGQLSGQIVQKYSFETIIQGIKQAIQ
jgi:glycosyltransferase involved in cell wall biosynthesis